MRWVLVYSVIVGCALLYADDEIIYDMDFKNGLTPKRACARYDALLAWEQAKLGRANYGRANYGGFSWHGRIYEDMAIIDHAVIMEKAN